MYQLFLPVKPGSTQADGNLERTVPHLQQSQFFPLRTDVGDTDRQHHQRNARARGMCSAVAARPTCRITFMKLGKATRRRARHCCREHSDTLMDSDAKRTMARQRRDGLGLWRRAAENHFSFFVGIMLLMITCFAPRPAEGKTGIIWLTNWYIDVHISSVPF